MTDLIHPPRVAEWLITLFTPVQEAEALLGDRIAVDSDERALRAEALRHEARVAPAAEGAVDRRISGLGVEHGDELGGQDRDVHGGHVKQDGQLGR